MRRNTDEVCSAGHSGRARCSAAIARRRARTPWRSIARLHLQEKGIGGKDGAAMNGTEGGQAEVGPPLSERSLTSLGHGSHGLALTSERISRLRLARGPVLAAQQQEPRSIMLPAAGARALAQRVRARRRHHRGLPARALSRRSKGRRGRSLSAFRSCCWSAERASRRQLAPCCGPGPALGGASVRLQRESH